MQIFLSRFCSSIIYFIKIIIFNIRKRKKLGEKWTTRSEKITSVGKHDGTDVTMCAISLPLVMTLSPKRM